MYATGHLCGTISKCMCGNIYSADTLNVSIDLISKLLLAVLYLL